MCKKFLVFVVHYNSFNFLKKIVNEINLLNTKNFDVLISDDCSNIDVNKLKKIIKKSKKKIIFNRNKNNFGYGKNIKFCLNYAIKKNYDFALMLHGDNQYKTKYITTFYNKIKNNKNKFDIICGSRMMNKKSALNGKMPIYKFVGNLILTSFFNYVFKSNITDAHSGLWLYNLSSLKKVTFEKLDNGYLFDHELRIEFIKNGLDINNEISIETQYSTEKSNFHILYAFNFLMKILKFKILKN